jgi:hypothetical protein
MSVDFAWYLEEPELTLADVRVALDDVAARHPGVVIRRSTGGDTADADADADAWLEGQQSFLIGFPADLVKESGDEPGHPPDEAGLHWGEILFTQGAADGEEDDVDDVDGEASIQISSTLLGGESLWSTLSGFAAEVAVELGARPEDGDDEPAVPAEPPLTWARIRRWIRSEELEITAEEADSVSVVLRWGHDGRSQTVKLTRAIFVDAPWLTLSSFVGKPELLPATEALMQNATSLASLAQSEDDELLYLMLRIPLAGLTVSFLDAVLWDLGAEADLLESEISGGLDVY